MGGGEGERRGGEGAVGWGVFIRFLSSGGVRLDPRLTLRPFIRARSHGKVLNGIESESSVSFA